MRQWRTSLAFQLSKWYLDCVSDTGEVFLGYCAELRWRLLSISYESALVHSEDAGTNTCTSVLNHTLPELGSDCLSWNTPALGVRGTWTGPVKDTAETIYSSAEGEIVWSCYIPRSEARVTTPAGSRLTGLGYAEHLSMSVPPWRIPISELRWGRFLSEGEALVWIEWRGPCPRTIVYRNSIRVPALSVDDRQIALADGARVYLDQNCVLRTGALGATVLGSIPAIGRLAPVRILATQECKWRSSAVLSSPGRPDQRGWAIHEVVRWP